MGNFKTVKIEIEIQATQAKVWDVVFNNFGEVGKWNPLLDGSHHSGGAKGEVGCERVCDLDAKNSIQEKITAQRNNDSFDIDIIKGGLPMMKKMGATIDVKTVGPNRTRVTFNMKFVPQFGILTFMMKSMLRKMMGEVVIALKYFVETGKEVNKKNIKEVVKAYKNNESNNINQFNILQAA